MRSNPRPVELSWYAYRSPSVMRSISSLFPGGVGDALTAVPNSAARHVRRAAAALTCHLPASAEAAWEALKSYGKSQAPRHRGCVPWSSCANWLAESAAYECRNFVGILLNYRATAKRIPTTNSSPSPRRKNRFLRGILW